MTTLKQFNMTSALLLASLVSAVSCSDTVSLRGSTIDEITILEKDKTEQAPAMDYQACLALADITSLMADKAVQYKDASQNAEEPLFNCVYVYKPSVDKYADNPEKLAARIALNGFRGVYLSPGGSRLASADNWLRRFISTCSDLNIEVYATFYEDPEVFVSEVAADACIQKVLTYNRTVPYKERFSGISADLEPHTIKTDIGLGWIWNTNNGNGEGGPNDSLLKVTLDRLELARNKMHTSGLRLHEAIWCHYQEMYSAGKVTSGSINHFTDVCDWVSLMAYRSNTDSVWAISTPSLDACEKNSGCINICIKTATNDEPSTTLLPNGWNALIETVGTLKARGLEYSCFNGIDMFQYDAFETMWEWVNDKN